MKKFEIPTIEIEKFKTVDVITTSCGQDNYDNCAEETALG